MEIQSTWFNFEIIWEWKKLTKRLWLFHSIVHKKCFHVKNIMHNTSLAIWTVHAEMGKLWEEQSPNHQRLVSIFFRHQGSQQSRCYGIIDIAVESTLKPLISRTLTHWGRDKMAAVSQTTLSNAFSWMNMLEFWLRIHWSLFLRVQLTIIQHWFR